MGFSWGLEELVISSPCYLMIRRFGVFHLGQVLPVLRLYLGVSPSLFLIY